MTDEEIHLKAALESAHVPPGLHNGLIAYVLTGRPTGSFLEACLSNDLHDACARGDLENVRHLFEIVYFLTHHAPDGCWGSRSNYALWVRAHAPDRLEQSS